MNRFGKRKRVLLSLAALFFFVLVACVFVEEGVKKPDTTTGTVAKPALDEKVKETIVGKWKRFGGGGDTIEFGKDGTVIFYSAIEKAAYPGTYQVIDDRQISTTMDKGEAITWGFSVVNNDLALTAPTGLVLKYRKIQ